MAVHQILLGIEADGNDIDDHDAHPHGRQILLRHPSRSGLRPGQGALPSKTFFNEVVCYGSDWLDRPASPYKSIPALFLFSKFIDANGQRLQ